jgi:hypothetical protein
MAEASSGLNPHAINGLVDDLPRDAFVVGIAQVMAATTEGGDFGAGASEIAKWNSHNEMILGVPSEFRTSPLVTSYPPTGIPAGNPEIEW